MKKLNKLLALVLAMVMTLSLSVTALGAWYDEAVAYVTENSLMDKVSETDFAPNTNADRATVVVALYRLAGSPEVTAENPFTDVAEDASYRNAVVWAKENNVTNGTSETTFNPTGEITRQDLVTLLYRYTKNSGKDVSVGEDTNILSYEDVASVKEYAIEAFQWACGTGVIGGSNGNLLPRDNTTRAHLATIVMRYAEMDFEAAEEKPSTPATLAEQIAEANKLDNKEFLAYESTITGVITDDPQASSKNEGSYKFTVSDGTNTLLCYFVPVTGGTPKKGDTVTVTGKLTAYNGSAQFSETNSSAVWVSAGTATETETPTTGDPEADSTLTIAEAIALGASKEHNTYTTGKYYVTGVITEVYNDKYGNMKITDEEGNILTIYGTYSADGNTRYDALETKPVAGDTVTIYGIVGQYSGTPQIKNGWITEHTPAGN